MDHKKESTKTDAGNGDTQPNITTNNQGLKLSKPRVSVYNSGPAVVQGFVTVELQKGLNGQVVIEGLPPEIDEDSIKVIAVTRPKGASYNNGFTSVRRPTGSMQGLMDWIIALDKASVTINGKEGQTAFGKLLTAFDGQLVIDTNSGFDTIPLEGASVSVREARFPGHLTGFSSLVLTPTVSKPGSYKLLIKFETPGINWEASYLAINDQQGSKFDHLVCTAHVPNRGQSTFTDATLKLYSGNKQGRRTRGMVVAASQRSFMAHETADYGGQVQSLVTGDRHHYPLVNSEGTIAPGPRAAELGQFSDIPYERELYVPEHLQYQEGQPEDLTAHPVPILMRLVNKLGADLPSGKVSINNQDDDGYLEEVNSGKIAQRVAQGEACLLHLDEPSASVKVTLQQINYDISGERSLKDIAKSLPQDWKHPQPHGSNPPASSNVADNLTDTPNDPPTGGKKVKVHTLHRRVVLRNYGGKLENVTVHVSLSREQQVINDSSSFKRTGPNTGFFKVPVPGSTPRTKTAGDDLAGEVTIDYQITWTVEEPKE